MSRNFRIKFVLMALGRYGYGDHVSDPIAFEKRLSASLRSWNSEFMFNTGRSLV